MVVAVDLMAMGKGAPEMHSEAAVVQIHRKSVVRMIAVYGNQTV